MMKVWCIDSPGYGGSEIDFIKRSAFLVNKRDVLVLSKNVNAGFLESLQKIGALIIFKEEGNTLKKLLPSFIFFLKRLWTFRSGTFIFWTHHIDSNRWLQLSVAFFRCKFIVVERLLPRSIKEFSNSRLSLPVKKFVAARSACNVVCGYSQIENYKCFFKTSNCLTIPNSRNVSDIKATVIQYKKTFSPPQEITGRIILTVGRLSRQKDQINIINAFNRLRCKEQFSLVILGEGELFSELEALIARLGVSNIHLLGFDPQPMRWLANADVFILNSLSEGLPGALIEAMAAGVPCIASDIPGNNELIVHEKTGLLVKEKLPEELAMAIERLISDYDLRKYLSANAYRHVLENYSLDNEKLLWDKLLINYK